MTSLWIRHEIVVYRINAIPRTVTLCWSFELNCRRGQCFQHYNTKSTYRPRCYPRFPHKVMLQWTCPKVRSTSLFHSGRSWVPGNLPIVSFLRGLGTKWSTASVLVSHMKTCQNIYLGEIFVFLQIPFRCLDLLHTLLPLQLWWIRKEQLLFFFLFFFSSFYGSDVRCNARIWFNLAHDRCLNIAMACSQLLAMALCTIIFIYTS